MTGRRHFRTIAKMSALSLGIVAPLTSIAGSAHADSGAITGSCIPHCAPVYGAAYGHVYSAAGVWKTENNYNSAGGVNTVTRTGLGLYTVTLPGLTASGGSVNVTGGYRNCNTYGWTAGVSATTIDVRCFGTTGAPINSDFYFTFTSYQKINSTYSYAWVDDAVSASSTPNLAYQWDSSATITVTRSSAGHYNVKIPYAGYGTGGAAHVTAYGTNDWCQVGNINTNNSSQHVYVECQDPLGNPVDSQFTITYLREIDEVNAQYSMVGAYMRVDPPAGTNVGFGPTGNYWSYNKLGGLDNIYKGNVGEYYVHFLGLTTLGNVQVTTIGGTWDRCHVSGMWVLTGTTTVQVNCTKMNNTTKPVDVPFMIQAITTV